MDGAEAKGDGPWAEETCRAVRVARSLVIGLSCGGLNVAYSKPASGEGGGFLR